MTYVLMVLAGVVMGLIAAVPIGPVNLICIRRSFAFGPVSGFMSGLGAALGDGIFAVISGFGLTWLSQLIEGYSTIIELIGGAMMVWYGFRMYVAPPQIARLEDADRPDKGGANLARSMASAFALTITNPVTIGSFVAMFATLQGFAGRPLSFAESTFVVAGVVGGSAGWWLILTTIIGLFHARIDELWMRTINRGSGVLVALCGAAVLVHLARKLYLPG